MSKTKFNSRAPLVSHMKEFHGFSSADAKKEPLPETIVNFRVGADGSLQKRCGVRTLYELPSAVRSHWSGYLNGSFHLYILAGSTLYLGDVRTNQHKAIATVSTSEGAASFLYLQGTLYLSDGKKLYRVLDEALREAIGYVPLYGKDWDNDEMGEINEPMNILNPHVRITYHVSDPPSIFLRAPKQILSVEAIFRNGVRLSDEEFSLNTQFNAVQIPSLAVSDRLEAYFTLESDNDELRRRFCSTQSSVFFGSAEQSRNYFFGGIAPDTVFCSEHVPPAELDDARRIYDADPLYLPEGHEFRIPEQRHPIRGALRHKDHLLIFTENDTWLSSIDSTGQTPLPSVLINSELGCLNSEGCVLAQNDPITVDHTGVYRWYSQDPALTQRDAERISTPLDFFLTSEDLKRATLFYEPRLDELWLNLPSRNEVWIRSMQREEWFCFSSFQADRFFDADGLVGCFAEHRVCILDPSIPYDLDVHRIATPISAIFKTKGIDFGSERKKNLSSGMLRTDADAETIVMNVTTDTGESITHFFFFDSDEDHGTNTVRIRSGRFQSADLELLDVGGSRTTIKSVKLIAH